MHPDYRDILEATDQDPTWWGINGVPRFGEFRPDMVDIYAQYVVLIEIACQDCFKPFNVGVAYPRVGFSFKGEPFLYDLEEIVKYFHFGDPPRHNCVGDTMNCIEMRSIEVWSRDHSPWERNPELENLDLRQDWALDLVPPSKEVQA